MADKKQKTIGKEITFAGVGLHTGSLTTVKLKPAEPDTGVNFIRTDLEPKTIIPALYTKVIGYVRGTAIGINHHAVNTVEHLLSTLHGLEIDNIIIEMDNNEPPVFDGSSKLFVKLLLESGIVEQSAPKHYVYIKKTIAYTNGMTKITAYPSDKLILDCSIEYDHPLVSKQNISLEITPENFIKEISAARTYCFDFEIESLKKIGLAKGGGLENTVIIGVENIHNPEKLRYPDEFVRHKLLDLLGDIYLLGKPIIGRIVAVRSGHKHNINFAKLINDTNE